MGVGRRKTAGAGMVTSRVQRKLTLRTEIQEVEKIMLHYQLFSYKITTGNIAIKRMFLGDAVFQSLEYVAIIFRTLSSLFCASTHLLVDKCCQLTVNLI